MVTKQCTKCLLQKEIKYFSKDKKTKDGLKHFCKDCVKADNKKYYSENRKKIISDKIKYQKSLPEGKKKEYDRNYRLKNPEKFKKYEKIKRQKQKFKEWRNKYEKQKRDKDPSIKLRTYVSNRIRHTLKKNLSFKDSSCLNYLPYTVEQLKQHLEEQFTSNMTWENYGILWHIDHIIPQFLLPFSSMKDENFLVCWGLKNLRPLEKSENLRKGKKTLEEYNEWKSKQSK